MIKFFTFILLLLAGIHPLSAQAPTHKKIGVLLVSHGSHSKNWRTMLFDVEQSVTKDVLATPHVSAIKSAFMEYTEPSIASQLKAFDKEGYTDVILIPMLLTVSSHSFDDIPIIAGQRKDPSIELRLKQENIAIYKPKAKIHMTPLLDFPRALENNLTRRIKTMSKNPKKEGIVLVAYGSKPYNKEWSLLMERMKKHLAQTTGINTLSYSWCGHIVHYSQQPTIKAINAVLALKPTAIVLPCLVAVDENFQGNIIGGAIEKSGKQDHIIYAHDAFLPDPQINQWVIDITAKTAQSLTKQAP